MNDNGALEGVLNHIVFHKAIIGEDDGHLKFDRYLEMARSASDGSDYIPKDPLDRSLQLVFELVLSQNFDPWDIDLVSFTDMYLKRTREAQVNFIIAGRLVFMAWSILKMQSERVLQMNVDANDLFCAGWDFDSLDEFCSEDNSVQVSADVPESVDLVEAIRHQSQRPVSLIELLDAFEDARDEAQRIEERARLREQLKLTPENFDPKSHSEDLEREVEAVWKRIAKCGPGPVSLDDLCTGDKEDRVTVFVSLLFLARNAKIALWQDDLPYGEIFLEMKIPWDIATLEDAKQPAEVPMRATVM